MLKTIAEMRLVCEEAGIFRYFMADGARRKAADAKPWSLMMMIVLDDGCHGYSDCDLCSLFQTQAAQTVLQSREVPVMPRMAILLGLMGVGMSGYSSRQLTLNYKPSSHLFR